MGAGEVRFDLHEAGAAVGCVAGFAEEDVGRRDAARVFAALPDEEEDVIASVAGLEVAAAGGRALVACTCAGSRARRTKG